MAIRAFSAGGGAAKTPGIGQAAARPVPRAEARKLRRVRSGTIGKGIVLDLPSVPDRDRYGLDPGNLRDKQVERGEAHGRGGGEPRRGVGREGGDGRVADE